MQDSYVPRIADAQLGRLVALMPAISVVGPRATGKTTTAERYVESVVHLDREAERSAFRADPDAALRSFPEPVLLDEWQEAPEVLGAVKRAVDAQPQPGRFILTGSVRAELDTATWPGTGRLVRVNMYGLTVREVQGVPSGPDFVDLLVDGDLTKLVPPSPAPDLADYVDLALTGGFPDVAYRLQGGEGSQEWLESYVNELLTRDATGRAHPARAALARYFETLALNSAGLANAATLSSAAHIDRRTAVDYDSLFENLLVLDLIQPWLTNRLSRLIKTPKRYLVDPSLVGAALRLDRTAVLRDGDVLGRLLDTFVTAQLRAEVALSRRRPRLYHLRDKNGRHEVDLVVELAGDQIVAIEIKATASPSRRDASHLLWLRDQLGDRFIAGAVLHTGPRPFPLDDKVVAVPIASIWAPRAADAVH